MHSLQSFLSLLGLLLFTADHGVPMHRNCSDERHWKATGTSKRVNLDPSWAMTAEAVESTGFQLGTLTSAFVLRAMFNGIDMQLNVMRWILKLHGIQLHLWPWP